MTRFVQDGPALRDPYTSDWLLQGWLDRHLGAAGHAAAKDRLAALSADVLGPLRAAHHDAETHPPALTRFDAWGRRVDRVDVSAGWETLRASAARHEIVALPYTGGSRTLQHALLHLWGPESATFNCPVAMADGAAALLSAADPGSPWLARLLSTDPDVAVTSGQWMTESQGGSDIARSSTVADRRPDGTWTLTGDKWFCSAIDSAMAIALARPSGAGPGSRNLAPFLVPRYADGAGPLPGPPRTPGDRLLPGPSQADGAGPVPGATHAGGLRPAPGLQVLRLKDKLGTRAVPTGEVRLDDVPAVPVGDPAVPGLARMMTLVVVTRLHNAAAAAGGMRRGLEYALSYAAGRTVAGGPLDANPLHRATLAGLAVDAAGAFVLAGHAFNLLGADPTGDELRLVAPLAKLTTGRLAVASASEYLEAFGGAGYVEDTGIPRLLRDAQVLPIWEGTTNVLSLDVLRALPHAAPLLARLTTAPSTLTGAASAASPSAASSSAAAYEAAAHEAAAAYEAEIRRLTADVAAAAADPRSERVIAGARHLALRLGHALTAALLLEHAAWATDHGDDRPALLASLWIRRHLTRDDITADLHTNFPTLT